MRGSFAPRGSFLLSKGDFCRQGMAENWPKQWVERVWEQPCSQSAATLYFLFFWGVVAFVPQLCKLHTSPLQKAVHVPLISTAWSISTTHHDYSRHSLEVCICKKEGQSVRFRGEEHPVSPITASPPLLDTAPVQQPESCSCLAAHLL